MAPSAPFSIGLPPVKTFEDCSDFSLTVLPFLKQIAHWNLSDLKVNSFDDVKSAYLATNPVASALVFSIVVAQIVFVVSTVNKNYSQIDRLWSILPALYNIHYWGWGRLHGIHSQRLDLLSIFSICWSARLTYNYWRKGGYNIGSEDYRWAIIKERVNNEAIWVPFNYIVISLFQSVLLAAVTTPAYVLLLTSHVDPKLQSPDAFFPQLLALLLVVEFIADNQQWDFHAAKSYYQKNAKVQPGWKVQDVERGFNTTGLWKYSRHPNFAAEQGIWLAQYQWGAILTGSLYNWSVIGAVFYVLVFQGSTPITEYISAGKYPEYKAYQEYVGRFVPKLTGPGWEDYLAKQAESGPATSGAANGAKQNCKKSK